MGNLIVTLYLHDSDKVNSISICVTKFSSQTESPLRVEIQERCIPNLNEEYTSQPTEECTLDLNADLITTSAIQESQDIEHDFLFGDDTSNGEDDMDYPSDSHPVANLLLD